MLLFETGNIVSEYRIQLEDEKKAENLIIDLTQQKKVHCEKRAEMIWTRNGDFKRKTADLTYNGIKFENISPQSMMGEYNRGTVYSTEVIYLTPFTLTFAADTLNFQTYEEIDSYSQKYLSMLRASDWKKYKRLSDVVKGVNLEQLSKLMSSFSGDVDSLALFLKTYHPDLFYLREFIEFIRLVKCDEFYIPTEDEFTKRELSRKIELAKENSSVAKKLNLTIRGR